MNNEKIYVVTYSRVSTPKQSTFGGSIPDQEDILRKYCINAGWEILGNFKEQFTGTQTDRPRIKSAINFIKEQRKIGIQIKYFVFHKIDRLTRGGPVDYNKLKLELKKIGVQIRDIEGVIQDEKILVEMENIKDSSVYSWAKGSPSEMSEDIMAFAKKQERDDILKRTIPKEIKIFYEGYWVRPPNFGYKNDKIYINNLGKRVIQIPKEPEATWIKKIYELKGEKLWKDEDIVNEINKLGFKTKEKNIWDETKTILIGKKPGEKLDIRKLNKYISNPIYAGIGHIEWKGNTGKEYVKQKYPGLVNIELWNKANLGKHKIIEKNGDIYVINKDDIKKEKLGENINNSSIKEVTIRYKNNPKFPFGKLLIADKKYPNNYFSGNSPKGGNGKRYEYYTAINKKKVNIHKDEFEKTIINFFLNLETSQNFINLYLNILERIWNSNNGYFKGVKEEKKNRLINFETNKSNILKSIETLVNMGLHDILIEKNNELKNINNEINELKIDIENSDKNININKVKEYGKKLIENLGKIALEYQEHTILNLLFRLICRETPTYNSIVNRNLNLRPFFALTSKKKIPLDRGILENTQWQPHCESNTARRIWSPEF